MTVLDDPPRLVPSWVQQTSEHVGATAQPPAGDGLLCDGLPQHSAGPRFRFCDPNPVAVGRTYAQSLLADLPYLVGVLVRLDLHVSEGEWDCLVTTGVALDVAGLGEFRVPFTLDLVASPPERVGRAPDGVCPDCWGTGYDVDADATMTGVLGALFVCFCAREWT